MKRKLNLRVLALLVTVTGIAAFSIHKIHQRQVHHSIDDYLRRVGEAEAKGDLRAAGKYLRIYLSFRPDDFEAMSRFALLLCDNEAKATASDLEKAARMIEVILLRDGDHPDLRRRLARLDMRLNRNVEARDHLTSLLDNAPRDAELHLYLAEVQGRLGDFPRSALEYDRARTEDPTNVLAYARLAHVLRMYLKDITRADKLMDIVPSDPSEGVVTNNPKSSLAWLYRATYRHEFGMTGAREDIVKSLALDPDNLESLLLAADLASEVKPVADIKTARAHIEHAIAKFPTDPRVYLAGAQVELRARNVDAATARLEAGVDAIPTDLLIRWTLVDLKIQAGRLAGIAEEIAYLRAQRIQREVINYLDAQLLYAHGQWAEASRALERVGQSLVAYPMFERLAKRSFVRLGECYERLSNIDLRLNAYQRAVAITPRGGFDELAITARSGLASALIAQGRIDRAIEEYRKNMLLPEATEDMRVVLARLLIFRNLRQPESSRRWEEIESLLDLATKKLPDSTAVTLLRAETLAAQRQMDRAQELLTKVRDLHPEKVELWIALSVLAQRQDRNDDALQIFKDAEKRLGDKADIRIARARYWSLRGGAKATAALKALTEDIDKFSKDERFQLTNSVAESLVRLGEVKVAMAYWEKLSRDQPNNLLIRMYLFDAMFTIGNDADIETAIDGIQKIEGEDGSLWRFGKARLLMRRAPNPHAIEIDRARQLLEEIVIRRPAWPRAPLCLAEIDDVQDHTTAALKNYKLALDLGDRSPQAIRRTVQLLYKIRRYDQADQVLRQLQEDMPISIEMQRLAADVSLQTHDYARALDLARRAVSKESAAYTDHVWLGQLLWTISRKDESEGRKGDASARRAEAETSLRRAVELGRAKADAWIALIQFLSGSNNIAAAETAIAEAEKAIPAEERALPLAVSNEAIGRMQRAEILYKEAIEAHPDDPAMVQGLANFYVKLNRIDDAKPLLNRLIDLKSTTSDDVKWAKRILALAYSLEGREQEALKALTVLNDEGQEAPVADLNTQDIRVKARVYALQQNRDRRREAIRLLEMVNLREGARVDDRLLLGHLYENDGNWNKARDQYNAALSDASDAEKPIALVSLARGLLVRKNADEARPLLVRLRDLAPQAEALFELECRLAVLDGNPDRAVTIIRDFVRDKDSQVLICAALLEELALYPAAEELYRRYAALPGQPINALTLAEFLGRRGRTLDALNICEPLWKTLPPDKVAVSCNRVLYTGTLNQDACKRVSDRIEAAIKADPKAISLVFDLANVRSLQGRYAEAEKILRDVYDRDQTNVTPLNNLAWVLAMQEGKSPQALETIDRAIAVRGAIPEFLDTRGVIHLALGRTDLALKELEDAVSVAPSPDGYFHLARAYFAAKRIRDAKDALQEARNLGLKPDTIHPLERPAYDKLVADLPRT